MKHTEKATLADGRQVEYVVDPDKTMEGGMKQVYFTPDKSSVLCFFKDQSDRERRARLDAVIGKYNPTIQTNGEYWKRYYCWPTAIIQSPGLGVMCPTYPRNFFFNDGPWKGKEKEGSWFSGKTGGGKPFRDLMPPAERGTWINYLSLCIKMARAVSRLHLAGLAHSDLSPRNILIDPSTGQSIIIDIDSLVVKGIFPPDVLGTPGYIAPEVLGTCHLPLRDPKRVHPWTGTDLHALAVLIYQYLLFRHPLKGPKVNSTKSAEEDDHLSLGEKALFIEHPTDHSNRPSDRDLGVTYDILGPKLVELFNQAFVDGLHAPNRRPIAAQWEDVLLKTWDQLLQCSNPACMQKWFVAPRKGPARCPFCKTNIPGQVLKLNFKKEYRPGTWLADGELVIFHGKTIMKWHVYDNIQPNDPTLTDADRAEIYADCQFHGGQWILINRKLQHMLSPSRTPVAPNSAVALKAGAQFHLSGEPHGRIAEVEIIQ